MFSTSLLDSQQAISNLILQDAPGYYSVSSGAGDSTIGYDGCTSYTDTPNYKTGSCSSYPTVLSVEAYGAALLAGAQPICQVDVASDWTVTSPPLQNTRPAATFFNETENWADVVVRNSSSVYFTATRWNTSSSAVDFTLSGSNPFFYIATLSSLSSLRGDVDYTVSFDLMKFPSASRVNISQLGFFVSNQQGAIPSFNSMTWNDTANTLGSYNNLTTLPVNVNQWYAYSFDVRLVDYGTGYDEGGSSRKPRLVVHAALTSSPGQQGWIFSIRNLRIVLKSGAYPTGTPLTKDSELVVLRKPASALDANPRTNCPHLQAGLSNWHDAATWSSLQVPSPTDALISIPANKKVLISNCSIVAGAIYNTIIIPSGSELIFNDANITMFVRNIRVEGKLSMGSATCRLFSKINITFWGNYTTDHNIAPSTSFRNLPVSSLVLTFSAWFPKIWAQRVSEFSRLDLLMCMVSNITTLGPAYP
jgi:hypothetical protein